MPEQTKLFFWNNQNLFSNNYLEHHLPTTSLWTEQREKIKDIFETVKKSYETIQALKPGQGQEAELEDKFIRPVLTALGYEYSVQPVTKRGFKKKRPDYALFKDSKAIKAASADKENLQKFFSQSLTILESKYWNRRLNDSDKNDILDSRDPTAQTVKYLEDVHLHTDGKINWAILTNGKHWRLFYHKAASRAGNYFEIDLEEIITSGDAERFLYFYLFFSKDVFIPDSVTGRTWLDQHLKGTEEYAVRVSTKLKDLIFDKVFEGLAEGFVHYRKDNPPIPPLAKGGEGGFWKETDESKKDIFKGCLTLLYRMLFLLYAESRNLLPLEEDSYSKVSLSKLRKDIDNDIRTSGLDKMSKRSYVYWARLEGLSGIIANGDSALNVPVYNGGLFETVKDSFLSVHKMPDPFLAEAIKLLTVDNEGEYIDYSSLSVRHLGDIYEGLLEFHVQIAEEEMAEVKEKGKLLWKKASELKEDKVIGRKQIGDVYIENSKHERKATGSYYTPHYIVEYIVKNTVGTALNEKLRTAADLLLEYEKASKALLKQKATPSIQGYRAKIREIEDKIFDSIFGISVLDPAMGSGHFLVHTVDFIADRIVSFLAGYPENPVIRKIHELRGEILAEIKRQGVRIDESKLTEVNLIKRMVMKRCIYGVDLNDMAVELAKLSLWLDSFTLGAPLSFLDHHLKCGNSLIGTNIEELEKALTGQLFAINLEPLKRAIRDMIFVSDLPDATVEQVRESYKKFREANRGLEGYRILLDMLIAEHFGIADAKKMLVSDFDKIDLNNLYASIEKLPDKDRKLMESAKAITKEKKFFHWEIEFPEVFYEQMSGYEQKIQMKNNPGFDCVVGNPPYITLALGKGQQTANSPEIEYFRNTFKEAAQYKTNTYAIFLDQALRLSAQNGKAGMILPLTILTNHFFADLRKELIDEHKIDSIVEIRSNIFADAEIGGNSILILTARAVIDNTKETVLCLELDDSLRFNRKAQIEQAIFLSMPDFRLLTNKTTANLLSRLIKTNISLSSVAYFYNGIKTGDNNKFLSHTPINSQYRQVIRGRDIDRYYLGFGGMWVLFDPAQLWSNTNQAMFETSPKIIIRQTGDTLMGALDEEKYYTMDTTHLIMPSVNPRYLLTLINSKLLNWCHSQIVPEEGKAFAEVKIVNIENLPIPNISFTTPEKERKKRVDEAIELYEKYMLELDKGSKDEKAEDSKEYGRSVEDEPHTGGKKKAVSGEHSSSGKRVHGVRGRIRKSQDAERVSEESEGKKRR